MLRLLKYEMQRKWKMSLGVLIGYFVLYFAMTIKFSNQQFSIEQMPLQLVLFIILAAALGVASVIGAINNLRLEAKQNTRDLYFGLPMTAYSKVGSKVIVSLVEVAGATMIGGYTCLKAFEKLTGVKLWSLFLDELAKVPLDDLLITVFLQVTLGVMSILVVYLSFAIFRAFFSQVRFGGLITVIIYVGLNYLIGRYINPALNINFDSISDQSMLIILIKNMVFTSLLFVLTGYLFEKRVSFD